MNNQNTTFQQATKQSSILWGQMSAEDRGTLLFSDVLGFVLANGTTFKFPAKVEPQAQNKTFLNCDVKPSKKALAWFIGLTDETRKNLAKKYVDSHLPGIVNNIYLTELNLPSSAL